MSVLSLLPGLDHEALHFLELFGEKGPIGSNRFLEHIIYVVSAFLHVTIPISQM